MSNIKFPRIYNKFCTKVPSLLKWIVGPLRRASRSKIFLGNLEARLKFLRTYDQQTHSSSVYCVCKARIFWEDFKNWKKKSQYHLKLFSSVKKIGRLFQILYLSWNILSFPKINFLFSRSWWKINSKGSSIRWKNSGILQIPLNRIDTTSHPFLWTY